MPNGVATDFSYNANSWLSAIEAKQNAATLASSQYGFDNVGNITQRTTDSQTTNYGYDSTYQLTSAGSESFSYDRTGNRTNSGYSHNGNNELLTSATASYTYDENGNTLTKTINGQTTTYGYDVRNRLVQVSLPDGSTATYAYDPFGRRIGKTVNGTTTYFIYADEGLIGEYDATGANKKAYGWLPDGIWGTNPQFQVDNGNYYYYHNDHLGTPQRLTDEAGNTVWSASYRAFGQATVDPASTVTNNLRFPGQYADQETGLHYNWNRYYEPETGRYTQVDPIGFAAGDENLYRYVSNRSQNAFDPKGLLEVLPGVNINAGEQYGESAAMYWAQRSIDPNNSGFETAFSYMMGLFASLWTPCTSDKTFTTLSVAAGGFAKPAKFNPATTFRNSRFKEITLKPSTRLERAFQEGVNNPISPFTTRGATATRLTSTDVAVKELALEGTSNIRPDRIISLETVRSVRVKVGLIEGGGKRAFQYVVDPSDLGVLRVVPGTLRSIK